MMRLAQITISFLALSISTASAIECSKAPDRTPGAFWRYRVIDGAQCWYRGETVLPKADRSWPQPAAEPERIGEPPVRPLAPVVVRTVAFRPPEPQTTASESQTASGGRVIANGRVIASAVVVIGFSIVIAGMFWPMRRRREGARSQLDFLSFLDPGQAHACKLNQWIVASSV
jgi:hypothetical protein